ncbi:O-Antigen ligase [bacterium BMS3Abin15]|nr:O-Antigen ligase [bacterium BMS3Abin15]HDZ85442.1 O-antigen ligase domain-containing protein [Candidatus Moranbacteria bacterium]
MSYIILLFFCLYLPFQLAVNPATGIDLASGRIIILLLALFWILEGLKNKKIIIAYKTQTLLAVSFLFLSFLSLIASQNTEWSFRKLAFLFSIFPIYFIVSGIIQNKQQVEKIIKYLVWGTGIIAIIGIIQFLLQFILGLDKSLRLWASITPYFLGSSFSQAVLENSSWLVNVSGKDIFRAVSLFPDPHMFSFYLGLIVPWALVLYFFSPQKKRIYLFIFFAVLIVDFLTFSRGGYLGVLAGIVFAAVIFWKRIGTKHKKRLIWSLIVMVLIVSVPNPISERFLSSFNLNEGSNKDRLETWKNSVNVIKNNALLGVGLGNYPLEIKPSADYREPIYSHSLYLDIASETGIINAFIWIALIFASITSYLYRSRKNAFYLGGAISLVIFSVHSFFETPLFSARVLPLLLIIIALSAINNDQND